jgi:hypothetical protein
MGSFDAANSLGGRRQLRHLRYYLREKIDLLFLISQTS